VLSLEPGRILLAFSGGPDSAGLALRLRERAPLLAYVDHRLRGVRASRMERERVRAIAARLGLELVRTRVSPAGPSEAAARTARYAALEALARKHRCTALATAHTADDRAETILLNLLRGCGLRGLAALGPSVVIRGVARLRPVLGERRVDLRRDAARLEPAFDPSNRSTGPARGRTRALLLPALAVHLGEDPVPILCALGDLAAEVRAALEGRASHLARAADRRRLLAESPATFPYLVEALRPDGPPLTSKAYGSLRDFLRAGRGNRDHVTPGGEAWRLAAGGRIRISPRDSFPDPRRRRSCP